MSVLYVVAFRQLIGSLATAGGVSGLRADTSALEGVGVYGERDTTVVQAANRWCTI